MKKTAWLLVICMALSILSGCTLEIPSLTEAKEVIDAYVYYNQTGDLPPDVEEILSNYSGEDNYNGQTDDFQEFSPESPAETLENTLKATTKADILALARQYYESAYPQIESDTRSEYNRLITWKPDFSGKKAASGEESMLQKFSSINVTLALSYTNAKNFYIAMATSVFSINPEDTNAAGNFAAAAAAYGDDLLLEGTTAPSNIEKYYKDAEKIYHYALLLAGKDGKYNQDALPLLVSLGNLYLDGRRFEEAYACFQTALEIEDEYWAATEGLYNTYMALKQYKKALELIADSQKYPAFIGASVKVGEKREEDMKKPQISESTADEEALKQKVESYNTVESISTADFLDDIDEEAKKKLNTLIRQVQDKMRYKAPEITLISQYASLRAISEPMGESALEAFYEGLNQYQEEAEKLQEMIYLNDVEEETYMKIGDYANQYRKTKDRETLKKFYEAFSAVYPEFSIFTVNPYEYTNPIDIIVQRHNIENFNNKYLAYSSYLGVVNSKVIKEVSYIVESCNTRVDDLWEEMNAKIDAMDNPSEAAIHRVHTNYYPKIRTITETSWNKATQATVMTYQQKIKRYAEQMYNDCMEHVILISDDIVRQRLEDKLRGGVLTGLACIYEQVYVSFSFVQYQEDCGCDVGSLVDDDAEREAQRKAEEKERERLANAQIKKNMEAKKRFETGELDENSEYYKKIIKPYVVKIETPFFEDVVGPYKSSLKVKLKIPGAKMPTLEFGKVENHIRNTTTFNGGIEIGAGGDIGDSKAGVTAYLKFTATRGTDGQFAAQDVDIVGGGKVTLDTAFTSSEAGMEASAVRGTKSYANFSVTGDGILDDDFKDKMGVWAPNLKKEFWSGEYPLQ